MNEPQPAPRGRDAYGGRDPYNTADAPPASDVLEFKLSDTIEVITLSCE